MDNKQIVAESTYLMNLRYFTKMFDEKNFQVSTQSACIDCKQNMKGYS